VEAPALQQSISTGSTLTARQRLYQRQIELQKIQQQKATEGDFMMQNSNIDK
jgi:hypothetical protein